jgi:hypothetical protein
MEEEYRRPDLFLTKSPVGFTFLPMPKGQSSKSTKVVRTTVAAKVSHTAVTTHRATTEDVAARAFEIYEREGRPDGRHLAHWVQAEAELGLR